MPLQSPVKPAPSPEAKPAVVLDTNATLDWLVFADGGMQTLGAAIEQGCVLWLASTRMRDELARVLGYSNLARWAPDAAQVMTTFDRCAQLCAEPAFCGWTCADADDQVFIDLASEKAARWLVTHDRALRALARRARQRGITVLPPREWAL